MTNPIVEFNTQIEDFFDFLINVCPIDDQECENTKNDLVTYKGLLNAGIKMNKLTAIEKYIVHVLIHEEAINSRNENFFLTIDYGKNIGGTEKSMLEAMKFKCIWHKLSQKRRDKIFDYLIVITYWARQYFDTKYGNNAETN